MAQEVTRVTQVSSPSYADSEVRQVSTTHITGSVLAARVIWYIAGALLLLLAFRFVLALLGANPSNGFANFIYSTSHPFVAPFFGLFGYNLQYGVSKVETYTLVAMAVYTVAAWGLARLVTLSDADQV